MATLTSASSGLSGQYQKYFDKKLLTAVLQLLVMDQFGQVRSLPPNTGALTVRFTRPPAPASTLVQALSEGVPIIWVYLKGSEELIRSRMKERPDHFMKADMLPSQFEALEEPSDAITVDVSLPPTAIVREIVTQFQASKEARQS